MPVARIIAATREHLQDLSAELQQAGYAVEFADPGDTGAGADLVINADLVDTNDVVAAAARAASEMRADVVISPGCIPADYAREERRRQEELEQQRLLAEAREREERQRREAEERRRQEELEQRVLAESREREERQRREAEERHRQEELEQRTLAEAREREERQRREAEERHRQEELEQQRLLAAREREERQRREAERQAALAAAERARAERERAAREREAAIVRTLQTMSDPEPAFAAARIAELPSPHALTPRQLRSQRQQRLQRAALVASIVALIVMLGFAASLRMHPESPLPPKVVQNPAQQEVPFGPAHITPQAPAPLATPAPVHKKASPGRVTRTHTKRASRSAADDEVTIRQMGPARRQTAQSRSNDGVRRYSDQ